MSLPSSLPLLKIDALSKSFSGTKIIDDVSFEVRPSEVIGIIGRSGAGKSTLLRCLNMLETPDSGHIWLGEEEIGFYGAQRKSVKQRTLARQRASMAMVFQHFNLWPHRSVLQNIIEGPTQVLGMTRKDATEKALALLTRMGLAEKAGDFPVQLSGGQQQRVSIARALAMEPRVILFDEPTSALDPESVGEVLAVISELAGSGTTMMVVTHEMRFALQVCSRLLLMENGRLVEEATPQEIWSQPNNAPIRHFMALSGVTAADLR
ncbi:ectoine/hydroxyectoine ABC transporter ATP-binding protein EhuA [Brenneria roseae subsp. americana]|uniref:Ectoine/hydroxyectoine ABC transporter ATP-binding protein EhuA n=1 Tax=Brenneria roseae subsp. americana TaxID=1508507 RepID=A0A2U1TY89_9GAMM|nr:amino acid ABC transporter ATP-binding protein [Brenneria roseae]PWC14369.1 ectoine/hydroxyectoine ABC transporter ATP-binding protein EhuA [Brenneria roseae subsp. americana]